MSATNRTKAGGEKSARSPHDYYPTPPWSVRAILPQLRDHLNGAIVLDPCAGTGSILQPVIEYADETGLALADVRGVELDGDRARTCESVGASCETGDFLVSQPAFSGPRAVVSNPPYSLAQEFAEAALEWVQGGTVAMLLRLNWLEGKKRAPFHRAHPADVYVLSRRPSFNGRGTDATAYAWFVWAPNRGGRWRVLDEDGGAA